MLDAKERLVQMREQILAKMRTETAALARAVDERGEDTTPSQHPADVASDLYAREETLAGERDLERALREVDDALGRVERGVYGRCVYCGGPIAAERLAVLPQAARCIACQLAAERR